jgi:hypothetical protein
LLEAIVYARFDEINESSVFVYLFVCSWINEGNRIKQSEENLHLCRNESIDFSFYMSSSNKEAEKNQEDNIAAAHARHKKLIFFSIGQQMCTTHVYVKRARQKSRHIIIVPFVIVYLECENFYQQH